MNLSRPTPHLTTRIEVGVAYGSDLALVKADPARGGARLAARGPRAGAPVVAGHALRRLRRQAAGSCSGPATTPSRAWPRARSTRRSTAASREAGIEIPFPVRRVIQESGRRRDAGGAWPRRASTSPSRSRSSTPRARPSTTRCAPWATRAWPTCGRASSSRSPWTGVDAEAAQADRRGDRAARCSSNPVIESYRVEVEP